MKRRAKVSVLLHLLATIVQLQAVVATAGALLPPGVKKRDRVVHAAHVILIRAITACDEDA
jgi:hypothetical protein